MQHDTTTHNKVVKRYKLFLHNKCCMLLHEKLGSFDRGFTIHSLIYSQISNISSFLNLQCRYICNQPLFILSCLFPVLIIAFVASNNKTKGSQNMSPKRKICSKQNYQEWTLLTLVHTIRFSDPIIAQIQRR